MLKTRQILTVLSIVIAIIVIAAIGMFLIINSFKGKPNYAEEYAKPIISSLTRQGAAQKCTRGDNGFSMSNTQPWYQDYYEVNASQEKAVQIMERAAADGGFTLVHASTTNRGHLSVADAFIDAWWFDASKKSTHQEKPGTIELAMGVNAEGAKDSCGTDTIKIDVTHSVVHVHIKIVE